VIVGLYLVNKPDPKVTPDPNVPAGPGRRPFSAEERQRE